MLPAGDNTNFMNNHYRSVSWLGSLLLVLFMLSAQQGYAADAAQDAEVQSSAESTEESGEESAEEEVDANEAGNEARLLPSVVVVSEEEATVVGLDEYPDPLEKFNRVMFGFNDVMFTYVVIPLGNVYEVIPGEVRNGVSRAFLNIREPLNMVNHLAQGRLGSAGQNAVRFVTNTILGVGGIFDAAEGLFGVAPKPTSFNDTFIRYGVGSGPYVVLPLLGPTDMRGGAASIVDNTLHPVRLITDNPETTYIIVFDNFQRVVPQMSTYVELRDQADDPYVYFRNQYLQTAARDEDSLNSIVETDAGDVNE